MDVTPVKQRLYELLGTLVPYTYPQSLRDANFPAFAVFTGNNTSSDIGSGMTQDTRLFTMRLMVGALETGDVGQMEAESEPYYALVYDLFDNRPGLGYPNQYDTLDGVLDSGIVSDSGFTVQELAGRPVVCVDFLLEVEYVSAINPGA
jgi:hypothetical protein